MYLLNKNQAVISTLDLTANYQYPEKFLPYCEACNNYNLRWSCPPIKMDPRAYLSKYENFLFLGFKINYTQDFFKSYPTKEEAEYYSQRLLKKLRKHIAQTLLDLEDFSANSRSFGAGSCLWCCKCTRQLPEPQPCKKPEKMRYSLDTFGLDLSRLSEELLHTPILWQGDPIPPYHHLIFALGLKEEVSPELLAAIEKIELPNFKPEDLEIKHKKA